MPPNFEGAVLTAHAIGSGADQSRVHVSLVIFAKDQKPKLVLAGQSWDNGKKTLNLTADIAENGADWVVVDQARSQALDSEEAQIFAAGTVTVAVKLSGTELGTINIVLPGVKTDVTAVQPDDFKTEVRVLRDNGIVEYQPEIVASS